jgi:hypothetical protein
LKPWRRWRSERSGGGTGQICKHEILTRLLGRVLRLASSDHSSVESGFRPLLSERSMKHAAVLLTLLLLAAPAHAWNPLGHKVVCEIAWQQLDQPTRDKIVDSLRQHPRFEQDFAKKDMPDEDVRRWIFWHAGTWPDAVRSIPGEDWAKYNHSNWHYVSFPLLLGTVKRPNPNLATQPNQESLKSWNIMQATRFCLGVVHSEAPPEKKALAYSWILNLVADMHHPLHTATLYCEQFPKGNRGHGIKTKPDGNLYALWNNMPGDSHKQSDVLRMVAELKKDRELWEVDTSGRIDAWVAESHQLARTLAYTKEIGQAISRPGALQAVELPEDYTQAASRCVRARIVAAGLRLGVVLGSE